MSNRLVSLVLLAACAASGSAGFQPAENGPPGGRPLPAVRTEGPSTFDLGPSTDSAFSPYGVCVHLHRMKDEAFRAEECFWTVAAGIGRVRFDLEWWRVQPAPGAPFDFSHYDAVIADAERQGLVPLPILYDIPKWAEPVWEHLPQWEAFIEAVVSHYGDRLPEIEIWNEENLDVFWRHKPDPERYVEAMRVAYEAAKRANPSVRVLFGGTAAGVPGEAGFVRRCYELGAARWFDAMNFHPYGQPRAPEGLLDSAIEARRALMAEFGDGEKTIAITEHGWPTHDTRAEGVAVLRAGLKVARPEQKSWRVAYAATSGGGAGGAALPRAVAEALEDALPPGSSVEACFGARLRERLAAGDVDAVVYPFDETYPEDTFEDVLAFVEAGGVLVDFGGMPMWYPSRETAPGVFAQGPQEEKSARREALGIGVAAWWMDGELPRSTKAYPTDVAKAAGYRGDPAGENATRFFTREFLRDGDEFIPLLVATENSRRDAETQSSEELSKNSKCPPLSINENINPENPEENPAILSENFRASASPREAPVAAAVIRRGGGRRGCIVLSGLYGRGQAETVDETVQARYLVRSLAIAFAEGVESYYWYELRANEQDPAYSENHFGLMHHNLVPKPAWGAYRNFILARPAGSVQAPGPWRDETRGLFFPQWTKPDGTPAGVIWKTGATERLALRFGSRGDAEEAEVRGSGAFDVRLETGDASGDAETSGTQDVSRLTSGFSRLASHVSRPVSDAPRLASHVSRPALPRAAAGGPGDAAPRFFDFTGRRVVPARAADGAYILPVGESPVFFEGAFLRAANPL